MLSKNGERLRRIGENNEFDIPSSYAYPGLPTRQATADRPIQIFRFTQNPLGTNGHYIFKISGLFELYIIIMTFNISPAAVQSVWL